MLLILKLIAGSVDIATGREIVLHLAKNAISVVIRTTSVTCANESESKSDSRRPRRANGNKCTHKCKCKYMRLASVKMTWMT